MDDDTIEFTTAQSAELDSLLSRDTNFPPLKPWEIALTAPPVEDDR